MTRRRTRETHLKTYSDVDESEYNEQTGNVDFFVGGELVDSMTVEELTDAYCQKYAGQLTQYQPFEEEAEA